MCNWYFGLHVIYSSSTLTRDCDIGYSIVSRCMRQLYDTYDTWGEVPRCDNFMCNSYPLRPLIKKDFLRPFSPNRVHARPISQSTITMHHPKRHVSFHVGINHHHDFIVPFYFHLGWNIDPTTKVSPETIPNLQSKFPLRDLPSEFLHLNILGYFEYQTLTKRTTLDLKVYILSCRHFDRYNILGSSS
jgi:hypothetical protein